MFLLLAIKSCTVFFVLLFCEFATLVSENLRCNHAYQLRKNSDLLIFDISLRLKEYDKDDPIATTHVLARENSAIN